MDVVQEPNKQAGFVGFFQQLLGGWLQQQERKRKSADLMDIGNWAQGGFEGEAPKTRTDFGRDFTAKLMDPLYQANLEAAKGRTAYYKTGRTKKPTRDEIKYYLDRGYSVKDAVKKSRKAGDIAAGFKPRATSRTAALPKPITPTSLVQYKKHIDDFFKKAGSWRWGPNYKQESLLSAWNKFRETIGYDNLPDNQKRQIWKMWSNKARAQGNEAEWDLNSPAVKQASGLTQGGAGGGASEKVSGTDFENSTRAQSAPAVELDDIWALLDIEQKQEAWALNDYWEGLNEEERATAKKHILNGGKAEDIIRLLSGK